MSQLLTDVRHDGHPAITILLARREPNLLLPGDLNETLIATLEKIARPREARNEEWRDRGTCAEVDPELFFPEKGGSAREAKKVCASCEVRAECLEYALAADERYGIWGGLAEQERRPLRRGRTVVTR